MIDKYKTGRWIQIRGEIFRDDIKIIGETVIDNWWRIQGHRLDVKDIADIMASLPEVLVVGTGYAGRMKVPPSIRSDLAEIGIRIEAETTGRAVECFNRLSKEGLSVAGAFHLTC